MSHNEDPYRDLAQWLQEVARRPYTEPVSRTPPELRFARAEELAEHARWLRGRQGLSFALLAAAYLQYHMLDVMLQIAAMHPVVTFV